MHVYIECVLLLLQYSSVWLTKRARNHRESVHRSLCFSKEEPIFINPSVSVYFCACVCPFLLQYLWKTWCTSVRERGGGNHCFLAPCLTFKKQPQRTSKALWKETNCPTGLSGGETATNTGADRQIWRGGVFRRAEREGGSSAGG